MVGPRECHTEWSKPDREKEIPYDILYVWNLKRRTQTKVKSLSCVQLFGTPRTAACQAPPSMEFSRQGYWSGLAFPSPGDLPNPGIEPRSPALQADSSLAEPPGKPWWDKWTYLQNRKRFKDRTQNYGCHREGMGTLEDHVHTAIFKMDNQQGPIVSHMELCSMLCASLDGRRI